MRPRGVRLDCMAGAMRIAVRCLPPRARPSPPDTAAARTGDGWGDLRPSEHRASLPGADVVDWCPGRVRDGRGESLDERMANANNSGGNGRCFRAWVKKSAGCPQTEARVIDRSIGAWALDWPLTRGLENEQG